MKAIRNVKRKKALKKAGKDLKLTSKVVGKIYNEIETKKVFSQEQVIELLAKFSLEEHPESTIEIERDIIRDWMESINQSKQAKT